MAPVVVNQSGVGYGEDEGPEPCGAALNSSEPGQDGEENLLHGCLRILDAPGREIAQHL